MLAWMGYATLVGALFVAAGALLEHFSPWLAGRRRMVWLAVIGGSLVLAVAVAAGPEQSDPRSFTSHPAAASAHDQSVSTATGPSTSTLPPVSGGTNHMVLGTRSPADALQSRTFATALPNLDVVLILAWLALSALCIGVLIVSAWRVSRMRKGWRESVIAGVPVLVSHDVGPAVIGLVHHGIVVPSWVEVLAEGDQRTVMTHEREHVRAGDPLLLWGATLLVTLAPWNVALWYALRRLRHAIEIDCDARVLRSRPDTRAYCTLLLDVGERTLAGVAPVAALAEPATLLERRIDAMTAPVRAKGRRVALSAAAALALVAAACWTPRPEVAPRARIAALVNELNSLLARDSVQRTLSVAERASAMNASAQAQSAMVPPSQEYGMRVVTLARVAFPEAFEQRDDAILVTALFDADGQIVRTSARRFAVDEVFDPGMTKETLDMRNAAYLLSRVFPKPLPKLTSSGAQTMREAPHAIFAYGVLAPGEPVPPQPPRDLLRSTQPEPRRMADVTLSAASSGSGARDILIYSSGVTGVVTGTADGAFHADTLRVRLPAVLPVDLDRSGDVHFVSANGGEFNLSATIRGKPAATLANHARHMVLENFGSQLLAIK